MTVPHKTVISLLLQQVLDLVAAADQVLCKHGYSCPGDPDHISCTRHPVFQVLHSVYENHGLCSGS